MIYGYIYRIVNLINDKVYIGKSIRPQGRWSEHESELKHNKHVNRYLQSDWDEYGEDNFMFEIIDEAMSEEELNSKEQNWINKYGGCESNTTYNMTYGGYSNIPNLETRASVSEGQRRTWTKERRQKMSDWNKKNWENEEYRRVRSEAIMGDKNPMYGKTGSANPFYQDHRFAGENNPMYGVHRYDEDAPSKTRVICLETREDFCTMKRASKTMGVCYSSISGCCLGKRKTAGGYHWMYYDEWCALSLEEQELKLKELGIE